MIKKHKRILNVGCGKDTYGTDFVDLYPSRKEIKKVDIENQKLPFKNNTFNEVYSAFMIEHLKNINDGIKEMKRVLKKGGKIILLTDNAGWWAFHNSKSKASVHYGGYTSQGKKDIHYALFTPEHLKNHLKWLKFKNIKISYLEGTEGKIIKFLNKIISLTRFELMAFPHIKITGEK